MMKLRRFSFRLLSTILATLLFVTAFGVGQNIEVAAQDTYCISPRGDICPTNIDPE